ncbi:ABC transporter ATP-binding protein [Agromyces sp. Marseille-P2726]|uniref:ABC transporter ATP-binding protein n=1 Tax=Agromyces sp. Marseille-P2726 TaxID=2709132 RepID=UPI00156E9CEF|nr:ABC transporter ATP-binding protein [Agromyces sp. Marseille-P2726]
MSRLEVHALTVGYEDAEDVLHAVDLEVPDGALLAIVGPSGCGKTTLLRTIAGLVRARHGEVRIGQRMVTTHGIHLAPEKRRIGWVPQDAALFPHLSVAENIAFGLPSARGSARNARRAAKAAEVGRLLDLIGLSAFGDRLPAQLSGGQAQRVALARALASSPDVVLLDEPFGALDPILRAELRGSVRELLREAGVTGILVTHDQAEALSIADRVAVMRDGRVLQLDTPEQVYQRPSTAWVAGFVGDAVFLPGTWHAGEVACALGRLPADWVPDDGATASAAEAAVDGASVQVLIRPEELAVTPLDRDAADRGAADRDGDRRRPGTGLEAIVADVDYTGHDAMLELVSGDLRLQARVTAAGLLPAGARVEVRATGRVLAYRSLA